MAESEGFEPSMELFGAGLQCLTATRARFELSVWFSLRISLQLRSS
jgi:hypothetical protein